MTTAPTPQERAQAARAHLSAWLNLLPLFGVFAAAGIYRRSARHSPWVAQQALQSSLFQLLTFNLLFILLAIVIPAAAIAWDTRYGGADLVLATLLTALPVFLSTYFAQAAVATRAARAVRRGENFRHPLIGRLIGAPAATAADAPPD